ncbi:MAG: hypothetical protein IAI50_01030 [Candidatus Eremiobacteraeota bacterium]|nr:hypothetical protein [Candidatus Eremiobacteraeota bacterium]
MIARPLWYDDETYTRVGTRSGRTAALSRRVRTKRRRYAAVRRMMGIVGGLTLGIVVYLGLMANVTWMNYELAKSAHERARLQDVSARLDEKIARLESRERLAVLANRLGMRDPSTFAQIQLPAERHVEPTGIALLRWLK